MHPVMTVKHWGTCLHEGMQTMRHHISDHLHSRHFWAGVGLTLLVVGIVIALFVLASHAPYTAPPRTMPYLPYPY